MELSEITLSLRTMRPNIVQSIRALRVDELQGAAEEEGQVFLRANLRDAQTKQEVLDSLVQQFALRPEASKSLSTLSSALTGVLPKSMPQPGFVVVLEQIPVSAKFDKEDREQLLDIFRDAADQWGDRRTPFRCFFSFA